MVRIIGHRGASVTHTENTVEAFVAARDQGAYGVELDVRRAADDVLIVHHDAHLADGRRLLTLRSDELPEWVPTLSEALDACSGLWVNVEIKNAPDDPDYDADNAISLAVAGLLSAHAQPSPDAGDAEAIMRSRFLVSSFNPSALSRIGDHDSNIPLGLLVWAQVDPAILIQRAVDLGVDAIHPHNVLVDRRFVERAKGEGLAVNVWTVDDPQRVVELVGFGVDGIITNVPGPTRSVLVEAGLLDPAAPV